MNSIDEDMKTEYDPSLFDDAQVGKYATQLRASSNVVLVEPDVAVAFPNNEAVNNALRQLIKIAQQVHLPHNA